MGKNELHGKVQQFVGLQDVSDGDFLSPSRDIMLPPLPQNVLAVIGSQPKPVVIKKGIFEKNKEHHAELTPEDSRNILANVLYNPDLVGQSQPQTKKYYWLIVKTGDKQNAVVVIDAYPAKNVIEVVGWRKIRSRSFEQLKRQSEREGGQFLILSPTNGLAAGLSALPSD
ncbi:MAG: hypothetical protein LBB79_07235 [Prevotellaceae bacterium]|nr:hypothetical protein [Prevotellaceae bacterium]